MFEQFCGTTPFCFYGPVFLDVSYDQSINIKHVLFQNFRLEFFSVFLTIFNIFAVLWICRNVGNCSYWKNTLFSTKLPIISFRLFNYTNLAEVLYGRSLASPVSLLRSYFSGLSFYQKTHFMLKLKDNGKDNYV